MQLRKIILKGFKSFPEKTVLEFNEGVTAIVGPNGSGKSNIIEAIRWVMGEQSAKILRGNRMNDVIFSGTNERKALNIAEVELVLDNSDQYLNVEFEEVSVLRRISRSGDSTYMINKQECRLKDIVDLFMDSGLGKESFSIISQGQVEAIFNSKPEERRGIFEEAAGVYKYKVRKRDAEKKLDQTQENLDRVQDILYELESQVEPLRKQADIAQSYLDQREKLTDLDIGVTVWKVKNLTAKINEDKEKQNSLKKELVEVEQHINKLEDEQTTHQEKLTQIEETRDQLNRQLVEVVREKERTEASLNLFDEKARHREEFIDEKNTSINKLDDRNKQLLNELAAIKEEQAANMKQYDELNDKIKSLQEQSDYLEGDKELQMEKLRSHYIELLQEQTTLKNEINHLEQELERNTKTEAKTDRLVEELEQNISNYKDSLTKKEVEYQAVSEELRKLLNSFKTIEHATNKNQEILKVQNERVANTRNELERAKAKKTSLTEMQENYAGYYAGVRAVMKQKEQLSGIVGTVAELIKIPTDYMTAVDTVLGSSGQFIIVDDEKSGRAAINYLKKNKQGRATFLPLTTIRPRTISENVKAQITGIDGFVGIASELVENDSAIQNIIDNLLGQTILATTLEVANKIARTIKFRNRVVSLEGDIINAGGSMTGGGRQKNTSPIFSQKAELDELKKFIDENEKVIAQLIENQEEVEAKQDKLVIQAQEVRTAGEDKRLEEQQLKNEIESLQSQLERLERELKATSFEVAEAKNAKESYTSRFEETTTTLAEVNQAVDDCNERMELLTSEQENIDQEKEKITSEINAIYEKRNEVREFLASNRANQKHVEDQKIENNEQIEQLKEDIASFAEGSEFGSKEELEEKFATFSKEQIAIEAQQVENREAFQKQNRVMNDLNEQITSLTGRSKYLSEKIANLDIRLSKNDVRMDHDLDYLVNEYKISFEEAKLLPKLELTLEEAQKQVKLLKKGIEELGPVNLNAITEFKNVNDRYQFLAEQQNDLIEAKANLYNTMDEMDTIVEKRFETTFNKIQKQFSIVFPKMFGGGYAELVLNEPNNLLETGIEIIAQPPGKRLTRLSLLSGGERALTAISLLFAIIQVNPIPFCILDEAEAALDDANVVRFGKYLKEFEDETQFIVITHRKGTMEHADQLYGVTMQEKGISKIVSVSLSEAQQMDGVT